MAKNLLNLYPKLTDTEKNQILLLMNNPEWWKSGKVSLHAIGFYNAEVLYERVKMFDWRENSHWKNLRDKLKEYLNDWG